MFNRCTAGSTLSFYRFPIVLHRRALWIAKINRKNWTPSDSSRICSANFIKGEKRGDPLSPDYVPTVFNHTACHKREQVRVRFTSYERRKETRRKRRENVDPLPTRERKRCVSKESIRNVGTMTDTTMDSIASGSLERENSELHSTCQMLTDKYQELSERHQKLAQEYQDLEDKYHTLSEEYQKC